MKAAALRHLLLDRARHAISGGDNQGSPLQSIVQSLSVTRDGASFELRWSDPSGEHTLNVPLSTFSFYITGDNPAAITKRQGTLNLRAVNWEAAADVLGRMVATSGGSFRRGGETYGHVLPSAPPAANYASPFSVGLTVIAAAIAGWLGGPLAGTWALIAAALSFVLLRRVVSASGQTGPMPLEEIILTVFVVATAFGGPLTPLALVLLAVTAPCIVEIAKGHPWSWLLAGFAGAPALAMGTPGIVAVSVLALAGFASSWMMSDRFSWAGTLLYLLGALLGFFLPHDWFALQGKAPGVLALAPTLLLGLSFALWWFHGVHRQVYPWYAQLGLAAAAGASFGVPGWSALAGFTGFGLVISTRVIRIFLQSRRQQR